MLRRSPREWQNPRRHPRDPDARGQGSICSDLHLQNSSCKISKVSKDFVSKLCQIFENENQLRCSTATFSGVLPTTFPKDIRNAWRFFCKLMKLFCLCDKHCPPEFSKKTVLLLRIFLSLPDAPQFYFATTPLTTGRRISTVPYGIMALPTH